MDANIYQMLRVGQRAIKLFVTAIGANPEAKWLLSTGGATVDSTVTSDYGKKVTQYTQQGKQLAEQFGGTSTPTTPGNKTPDGTTSGGYSPKLDPIQQLILNNLPTSSWSVVVLTHIVSKCATSIKLSSGSANKISLRKI